MPTLARINVFPLKSFDPQPVERATLLASGALAGDRRYALRNGAGLYLNGKRSPALQRIRSTLDAAGRLTLRLEDGVELTFDVARQRGELSAWMSGHFGLPVELVEDAAAGFPDDTDSPGPTVISTATLEAVAGWFGLTVEEARRRFRANLEIDGVEPFWEDRLVAEAPRVVRFEIGAATLLGTNPCQRCPVPSRDSHTGLATREFAKTFARRREATLPAWAPASRFNHFYRLAVNTRRGGDEECALAVGDEVRVVGVE